MEETNEQYFDRLAKGTGREMTPGFREWMLDTMEELGERPSDSEISMMHLAYQAGMEQGREGYERFASLVLDEATNARAWHSTKGMKPALTPPMSLSYALSLLRDARHCGIDVDALIDKARRK